LQLSIIKFIILINRSIQIYLNKKNIYCNFHDISAKKMFDQKRFAGRHLLTFESQKLNYFGKKVGPAFWDYNVIRIWAMSGPFSRFLVILYPLSPRTYITEDYTSLCLNIICNRSLKWCQLCSGTSFTQGWKDIGAKTYLFTACANCYLRF
jgi:hypothetical protein